MSLVIHYTHAYAFLGGLFMGKFTNLPSDIIITGLVLYIVTPDIYTKDRWERVKSYAKRWFGPKQIVIQQASGQEVKLIQNTGATIPAFGFTELPKIEVLTSKGVN